MITKLYLQNWKSFGEATLYIDPITIVIGANASGKSNLMDAFQFLHRLALGKQIQFAANGDNEIASLRGGSDWMVRKNMDSCLLELTVVNNDDEFRYTIELTYSPAHTVELRSEKLEKVIRAKNKELAPTVESLFFYQKDDSPSMATYFFSDKPEPRRIDLNPNVSVLSQTDSLVLLSEIKEGCQAVLTHLRSIVILDPIPANMRTYSKLSSVLLSDASNIAGVLAGMEDSLKEALENDITQYAGALPTQELRKIWAEKVGVFQTDAMLFCREQWAENQQIDIDARGMSDGTLRLIAIVLAILTAPEHSLLIIEDIDNGLHPSKAKHLVKTLKDLGTKRNIDILCTTHNPALLDAFDLEMLPFIAYVHRDSSTGIGGIEQLDQLDNLISLMSQGSIGGILTRGLFEKSLNDTRHE
jgi:predicted ATPase